MHRCHASLMRQGAGRGPARRGRTRTGLGPSHAFSCEQDAASCDAEHAHHASKQRVKRQRRVPGLRGAHHGECVRRAVAQCHQRGAGDLGCEVQELRPVNQRRHEEVLGGAVQQPDERRGPEEQAGPGAAPEGPRRHRAAVVHEPLAGAALAQAVGGRPLRQQRQQHALRGVPRMGTRRIKYISLSCWNRGSTHSQRAQERKASQHRGSHLGDSEKTPTCMLQLQTTIEHGEITVRAGGSGFPRFS
mmetsp:Transcript_21189/g.65608  ORF Transcript_21189/g.65608 Transcript_21189/m.65608 type:complete len:246 (+) Transcript_21189:1186-1923(+)